MQGSARGKNILVDACIGSGSLDLKILFLVSLETKQKRYRKQVITPFVNDEERELIETGLRSRFNGGEDTGYMVAMILRRGGHSQRDGAV